MTDIPQTAAPKKNPLRVTTPRAILSYPHLYEPQAGPDGGKAKYSACLVFEKGADLAPLKLAAAAAALEKFGANWQEEVRAGKIQWPFRNDSNKGYPEGAVFINCRSEEKPGLVSRVADPTTGKPIPITNNTEIYPGAIVRASVTAFAYNWKNMKKGVSFGLNNIQKLEDGKRLDNRVRAEDDFEADMKPEAAAASLDDLMK